jgi:hypothetical protein
MSNQVGFEIRIHLKKPRRGEEGRAWPLSK